MRQNIINITNELAQGAGLDFDLMETYNAILNYCIKTKTHATPRKNQYNIINGCLYINNQFIKRVAPLPRKVGADPVADYYENKILTRQEQYYI
jgi:hypothetical protein